MIENRKRSMQCNFYEYLNFSTFLNLFMSILLFRLVVNILVWFILPWYSIAGIASVYTASYGNRAFKRHFKLRVHQIKLTSITSKNMQFRAPFIIETCRAQCLSSSKFPCSLGFSTRLRPCANTEFKTFHYKLANKFPCNNMAGCWDTSSEARINVSKSVLTLLLSSGMKRPLNEPKIGTTWWHLVQLNHQLVCTIRVGIEITA